MKIFVVHDEAGNIRSFGIPRDPSEGGPVLQAPENRLVTEVEFPEASSRESEDLEQLAAKLKTLRVDRSGKAPRLVQRGND